MKIVNIFLCSIIIYCIGCAKIVYLDNPTPPGAVPPPPPINEPQVKELERTFEPDTGSETTGVASEYYAVSDKIIRKQAPAVKADASAGTIQRFTAMYNSKGKPRIAIFLNRTLSDEVREWRTEQRAVISGEGSISRSIETERSYREETVKGPLSVYNQQHIEEGDRRPSPTEGYIWSFEDGFMRPFLMAGTRLIDRGTIMRLIALDSGQQGSAYDPITVKAIEMSALVNKADVFIEILIAKYPSAQSGYEFKAVAKEVKTGRILANATSLNWDKDRLKSKKIIATNSGYEIVDEENMPKVQNVSRDLAIDLMNSLLSIWGLSD